MCGHVPTLALKNIRAIAISHDDLHLQMKQQGFQISSRWLGLPTKNPHIPTTTVPDKSSWMNTINECARTCAIRWLGVVDPPDRWPDYGFTVLFISTGYSSS